MKIIWSPFAHQRINEIADYIAADSLTAAEKWVNSLYDSIRRLKDFLTVRHGKQLLPIEDPTQKTTFVMECSNFSKTVLNA